jgi:hypothetical protein
VVDHLAMFALAFLIIVTKGLAAGSALRGPACQHHEKRVR